MTPVGTGQLVLTIPTVGSVDPASKFVVSLSPLGMNQTVPLTAGNQFVMNGLPPGPETITAQVVDPQGTVTWQGSTSVTIVAGQTVNATLVLAQVGGDGTGSIDISITVAHP